MSDRLYARFNPLHAAPNLLTLMRICLAPFLVSAILDNRFVLSFVLFIAAGLSDALDGTLARWLKQRTVLGSYLDPVADKLLLSTLFVVLTHKNLIPVTITVLVFGRDVGILLVAAILYAAVGRREFKPSLLRKSKHRRPGHVGGRGSPSPDLRRRIGSSCCEWWRWTRRSL